MVNTTLPYEMTQNVTGLLSVFEYIQGVSEGYFFPIVLFGIFIVVFISLKGYSTPRAFAGAAFLNFVLSAIMGILGLLSPVFSYLGVVLVGVAIVWLHIENAGR